MDRKIIMGVAAVAGIGLLLYMRKSGDQATISGAASLVGASSVPWSSTPIVINANTKPLEVADGAAASPAPSPAPVSQSPASVATWGGTTGTGPQVSSNDGGGGQYGKPGPNGTWIWPDGTKTGGGVTSQQAMSIMGY